MSVASRTAIGRRLGPVQRVRLVVEILRAYRLARRVRAHERLPEAVARLRSPGSVAAAPVFPDPVSQGARLGRAVILTLSFHPQASRCLMHSLVMVRLLAVRGARAQLVIAVHPGETVVDAHAWVELDDQPLLPPGTHHQRLLVL
jgi:hypothetical protein